MSKLEAEDYMERVENLKEYQNYCQHIIKDVNNALEALDKLEKEVLIMIYEMFLHIFECLYIF